MTLHTPVLLSEIKKTLEPLARKIICDGTLGGGGHTQALLEGGARVIGFDRDATALVRIPEHPHLTKMHANFRELESVLEKLNIPTVGGVLLDLGYSSDQMDNPARGFSYQQDGPLDMRMNQAQPLTAAAILHESSEAELARILWEYGEEPKSRVLARLIARVRKDNPVDTTKKLLALIEQIYPPRAGLARSHPAARTFQALRIAVNGEWDDLLATIPVAAARLNVGGKLAIITFNSVEDRLVKEAFRALAVDTLDNVGRVSTPSPFKIWKKIEPTEAEIATNRRARSAKVRVLERCAPSE